MSSRRPPDSSQSSLWARAEISPTELHTKLLIYSLAAEEEVVVLKHEKTKDGDTQKALSSVSERTAKWLEKVDPDVVSLEGDFTPLHPDLIPVEGPVSPVDTASEAPDKEDSEHEWDNDSTLDEPIWEDLPHSNQTDHSSTITAETLLVETFLDRVAEFVSPNHGANHITSAAIAGLRTERPRLVLTKNTAFTKESQAFLSTNFAESLRQVAEAKSQDQVRALKRNRVTLYENVCEYSQKRIRHHAAKLCQKWNLHENSLQPIGDKVTNVLREFCQKCQPDCLTTPDLVMAAYELTLNVSIKKLLKSEYTNHIDQVLRNLWFCARPRRAFLAFQELCYAVPDLRNLVIECLEHVDADLQRPNFWNLDQCKAFLGPQAEAKEFEGLEEELRVAPKRKLRAHCEIRLVIATGMPHSDFFNYIGGSKRPCWLCHLWLKSMGICIEESHSQLYGWWTFPSLPKYGPNQDAAGLERLISATRTFSATILGFLDSVIPRLTEADSILSKLPHSSLGETRKGLTQEGRPQQLLDEHRFHWFQAFAMNYYSHEAFHECCKTNLRKPGYCQSGCRKMTSRECSSCGEGFFCSEDHEGAHEMPLGRFNSHHIVDCVPKLKCFRSETERKSSSEPTSCIVCDASKAYPCRGCFSIFFCSPECYVEDPYCHVKSCEEYSRERHSHGSGFGTAMCMSGGFDAKGYKSVWAKVPEPRITSISEWLRNLPAGFLVCRVRRRLTGESTQDRILFAQRNRNKVDFVITNQIPFAGFEAMEELRSSQLGEWQVLNFSTQDYAHFCGVSPWDNCGKATTSGLIRPGSSILRSVKVNSALDARRAGGIIFANDSAYCNSNKKRRLLLDKIMTGESQIARKIGYPIVICRPTYNPGVERPPKNATTHSVLELLLLDTDPSSPTWGQSTLQDSFWHRPSDSFWVFADDGSFSINARLVERISAFCMGVRGSIAEGSLTKDKVNEELTRTTFDKFVVAYDEKVERMELPTSSEPTLDDSADAVPDGFIIAGRIESEEPARRAEELIRETHWLTDEEAG